MEKVKRKLLHQRNISLNGFLREDGLFDLEAELLDTKNYNVSNHDRGNILAGEPIHKMKIVLTIDNEMFIKKATAKTISSPFKICKKANNNFKMLEGLQIKAGWKKKINELIGNVMGCTHIREMLGSLATTAFQTIQGHNNKTSKEIEKNKTPNKKPILLGSCYAFNPNSEVVKRIWPDWYQK